MPAGLTPWLTFGSAEVLHVFHKGSSTKQTYSNWHCSNSFSAPTPFTENYVSGGCVKIWKCDWVTNRGQCYRWYRICKVITGSHLTQAVKLNMWAGDTPVARVCAAVSWHANSQFDWENVIYFLNAASQWCPMMSTYSNARFFCLLHLLLFKLDSHELVQFCRNN